MISPGSPIIASDFNLALFAKFGDGSDGNVTLDGSTVYSGFSSLSGSIYTLTRNIYAANLAINNGITLQKNGWTIFVNGIASGSGTVKYPNGNSASGITPGAAYVAGVAGFGPLVNVGGTIGGTGVSNTSGNPGTNGNPGTFDAGTSASQGGSGGAATNSGGAGGTTSVLAQIKLNIIAFLAFLVMDFTLTGSILLRQQSQATGGGSGGSNSSGSVSGHGGGAGASGGTILMFIATMSATWTIIAIGGSAGAGTNASGTGQAGGGGAGAAGTGGTSILIYGTKNASFTYTLTGGAGASGGTGQTGGGNGTSTSTGTTGCFYEIPVVSLMH